MKSSSLSQHMYLWDKIKLLIELKIQARSSHQKWLLGIHLPRMMGNPQEFFTSPHIRPSSNAGNRVHYLQQTQWNHFLNETPLQPHVLSQRLSFQARSQIPHSSYFLPLSYEVQAFNQQHAIFKTPKCVRDQQWSWKASGGRSCHSLQASLAGYGQWSRRDCSVYSTV